MSFFIAGFVFFYLMFSSKVFSIFLIFLKKKVALGSLVIVLSEPLLIYLVYLAATKPNVKMLPLVSGFIFGLVTATVGAVFRHLSRKES